MAIIPKAKRDLNGFINVQVNRNEETFEFERNANQNSSMFKKTYNIKLES